MGVEDCANAVARGSVDADMEGLLVVHMVEDSSLNQASTDFVECVLAFLSKSEFARSLDGVTDGFRS